MKPSLHIPCLCLVTDLKLCQSSSLEEHVEMAIRGGANIVQLREKDMPGGFLLEVALRLRQVTRGRALLFVNDRVDVALACGADGVQLGEEAMPVQVVRQLTGDKMLLGRSVHDIEGVTAASGQGADLLIVGSVFPTHSHPNVASLGIDTLRKIGQKVSIPLIGIGGIDENNIEKVIRAGAHGVAVVSAIMRSPNPESASNKLSKALNSAWCRSRTFPGGLTV